MLRFEEALSLVLELGSRGPKGAAPAEAVGDTIELEDAPGRVLFESLTATADLPGFDHSSMDGYAIRVADFEASAPRLAFPVQGESRTGAVPAALGPHATMRIFTGAAVPAGADAVVMQEHVARDGAYAQFRTVPRRGQHIRHKGDDLAAGVVAIASGTRLRPAHLALAASLDRPSLTVARRPKVAILATGDELRRPGTAAINGTIPESNTIAIRAMARHAGAEANVYPYVRDDRSATERAFAEALEESDVLVTLGGVSVGDHDLVRPALEAVGVHLEFWRVAMKPGKPLAIGTFARAGRRDALVIGLPGNPASAMVTFALFGVPLLRAMQGDENPFPSFARARMAHAYAREPGRREFVRAVVTQGREGWSATTLGNQSSGALTTMAQANALVSVPESTACISEGDEVDVLLMSDLGA